MFSLPYAVVISFDERVFARLEIIQHSLRLGVKPVVFIG